MADLNYKDLTEELKDRVPLMRPEWISIFEKMRKHHDAPIWNTKCGDRITESDLAFIQNFARRLETGRIHHSEKPCGDIIEWIESYRGRSLWFQKNLRGIDPAKTFHDIPVMKRRDMITKLEEIVPLDVPLERIIVNPTSGTTGRPMPCPGHPKAVGCYDPMIQFVLRRHGVDIHNSHETVAAIQVCAQKETIVYNTVHSYLNGAGFIKLNILAENWNDTAEQDRYINDMAPVFLSGDPCAFYAYMKRGLTYRPKAVLSTAITLEAPLRKKMEDYFRCPVIDFYSMNETGPIAYGCPHDPSVFHLLPTDLFIEALDDRGRPAGEGRSGGLAVTGGRNPFVPLLRYMTGDRGAVHYGPCPCGDPMPRIKDLQGRKLVMFQRPDGHAVNPLDIARVMRNYPVFMHRLIQDKDHSCLLEVNTMYGLTRPMREGIMKELGGLFGGAVDISIEEGIDFSEGKVLPYVAKAGG